MHPLGLDGSAEAMTRGLGQMFARRVRGVGPARARRARGVRCARLGPIPRRETGKHVLGVTMSGCLLHLGLDGRAAQARDPDRLQPPWRGAGEDPARGLGQGGGGGIVATAHLKNCGKIVVNCEKLRKIVVSISPRA